MEKREAHRIAVISDTHGLLRQEVTDVLKTCEVILHGGDVGTKEVLAQLSGIARTYAVRGNVDKELAEELPGELVLELFGFGIYMVHNKKDIRGDLSGIDIVIYGHSHKYEESLHGSITYLNPGSCGPRRFRLPVTMMVITLYPTEHRMEGEKIDCVSAAASEKESQKSTPGASGKDMAQLSDKDMYRLVRTIMREVDAGRSIEDIAARNRVDREFAEQICRMYLTHPGVGVNGILDRMERRNL